MQYEELKQQYQIDLNPQQEAAVQAVDGAVLLLAVPGSGKTTVIISRLGYMIFCKNIRPEKILTVTYTVAATKDMEQRFRSKFGDAMANRLEFRTINGICHKILQYFGNLTGRYPFEIADKEAVSIMKNAYLSITRQYATENDSKKLQTAITYVKNMRLSRQEIQEYQSDIDQFPQIYEAYNNELISKKLMDYDDQMVYGLMILEQYPQVLAHFREEYQYISMDEAQDTSRIQHDIINLLAGAKGNLFLVGDEDQSIYGFRAAYPKALVNFEQDHPNARVFLMETNYRSHQEIVMAADRLIQSNQNRHKKHMIAHRPQGGGVMRIDVPSRKKQYQTLAQLAKDITTETAILYRNHESALPIIDLLDASGIPYGLRQSDLTFFTHPVVTDICDFIQLALDPHDTEAFLRIYYKMGAGIKKTTANWVVQHHQKKQPLMDRIGDSEDASAHAMKKSRSLSNHFRKMKMESAGAAISRILHSMGYEDYMNDRGLDQKKAEILQILGDRVENLQDFPGRLKHLQEILIAGKKGDNSNLILSTIHSSKGLEYEQVYLIDMLSGIMPSVKEPSGKAPKAEEQEAYEEERRLFYVGMTRAKNRLHIFTFADSDTSSFSKGVFGIQNIPVTRRQSNTKQPRIPLAPPKIISSEELTLALESYQEDARVRHKKFGIGTIVQRKQDVVEILFSGEKQSRKLTLTHAVVQGILSMEEYETGRGSFGQNMLE